MQADAMAAAFPAVAAFAVLAGSPGPATLAVAVTTALCALLGAMIYGAYATIFSRPPLMAGYVRFRRRIETGLATFFAAAGLRLMLSRLAEDRAE